MEDSRKAFLKYLFKQYGDLPKSIFKEIVDYKTEQQNKSRRILHDISVIGSALWINKRINIIKTDINGLFKMKDIPRNELGFITQDDRLRFKIKELESLEDAKRKIINEYRWNSAKHTL